MSTGLGFVLTSTNFSYFSHWNSWCYFLFGCFIRRRNPKLYTKFIDFPPDVPFNLYNSGLAHDPHFRCNGYLFFISYTMYTSNTINYFTLDRSIVLVFRMLYSSIETTTYSDWLSFYAVLFLSDLILMSHHFVFSYSKSLVVPRIIWWFFYSSGFVTVRITVKRTAKLIFSSDENDSQSKIQLFCLVIHIML